MPFSRWIIALVVLGGCCFAGHVTPSTPGTRVGQWAGSWTGYAAPTGAPSERTQRVRVLMPSGSLDLAVHTTGLADEVRTIDVVLDANPRAYEVRGAAPSQSNGAVSSNGTVLTPAYVAFTFSALLETSFSDRTPHGVGAIDAAIYADRTGAIVDASMDPIPACAGRAATSPGDGLSLVCALP